MGGKIAKIFRKLCSCTALVVSKTTPEYFQKKLGSEQWQIYPYDGYGSKCPEVKEWKNWYPYFALTDLRVCQLHQLFKKIDTSGDGSISWEEFAKYFGFTYQTPLTERYFNAMDSDGSGELDFGEFAVACWNICANLDEIGMIMYAFDIYDTIPPHGQIAGFQAFEMLLHAYNGDKHMSTMTLSCVRKLRMWAGTIDKQSFTNFVAQHRAVFLPVFSIQKEMKKRVLNGVFWNEVIDDLKKMVKPQNRVSNTEKTSTFLSTGYIARATGIPWNQIIERLEPVMDFRRKAVLMKHGFIKSKGDTSLDKYDKVKRNMKVKKAKKKKYESVKEISARVNRRVDGEKIAPKVINNSSPTWRTDVVKFKEGKKDSSPMARLNREARMAKKAKSKNS
eukprot:g6409.t1